MDEELAEFTDRILSDQQIEETGASEELRVLKHTVSRLSLMVKKTHPEASMRRIEKQLMDEWDKNQNLVEKKPAPWLKFLPGSPFWKSQRPWLPAFALVLTVFFLIVLLPLTQTIPPNMQASAGDINQYRLVLFIIATVVVIGLLWFSRYKS